MSCRGRFPEFAEGLNDRVTFVAYRMLSAGCGLWNKIYLLRVTRNFMYRGPA